MSDVLSEAIYRAKLARQTPYVINRPILNTALEKKLEEAKAGIALLQQQNVELRGRIGGLTRQIGNLSEMYQAAVKDRDAARKLSGLQNRNFEFTPSRATIADITELTSMEFGIHIRDIKSEFRNKDITIARQVSMYLARIITGRPINFIARWFNRDHTTILHAVEKIKTLRGSDAEFDSKITSIERKLVPSEDGA